MVTIVFKRPKGSHRPLTFVIHKAVACFHIPVLDRAFNRLFIEDQTQTINFSDIEFHSTFSAVQSWMYTQRSDKWEGEWGDDTSPRLYMLPGPRRSFDDVRASKRGHETLTGLTRHRGLRRAVIQEHFAG